MRTDQPLDVALSSYLASRRPLSPMVMENKTGCRVMME